MIPMLPYKLIAGLVGVLILVSGAYYKGYSGEHEKLITYQAQVTAIGKAQIAQNKIIEAKQQEASDHAASTLKTTSDSIHAYYAAHPVIRVRYTASGSCGVPEAIGDTKRTDGATSSEYAPAYISEYNPEQVEQVANRLYQLQLLIQAVNN
jgi:hypothetical protein